MGINSACKSTTGPSADLAADGPPPQWLDDGKFESLILMTIFTSNISNLTLPGGPQGGQGRQSGLEEIYSVSDPIL